MCISFSEMYLSLGLNKLSGKNGKRINFRRYGRHPFLEKHITVDLAHTVLLILNLIPRT